MSNQTKNTLTNIKCTQEQQNGESFEDEQHRLICALFEEQAVALSLQKEPIKSTESYVQRQHRLACEAIEDIILPTCDSEVFEYENKLLNEMKKDLENLEKDVLRQRERIAKQVIVVQNLVRS